MYNADLKHGWNLLVKLLLVCMYMKISKEKLQCFLNKILIIKCIIWLRQYDN